MKLSLIVGASSLVIGSLVGYDYGKSSEESKWLKAQKQYEDKAKKKQSDLHKQIEELQNEAIKHKNLAETYANDLRIASDSLRESTRSTADDMRAVIHAEPSGNCNSAAKTAILLTELLASCGRRNEELAIAVDRHEAAGKECERQYNQVKKAK